MPYALNFYHDQITAGASNANLPAGHRLLYVRHGAVTIDGAPLSAGEATCCSQAISVAGAADWSQLWRWDLAPPGAAPDRLEADGTLSDLRLSRIITTLAMTPDSDWLFRLDSIAMAAGAATGRHRHNGPGVRCLLEGAFNVDQGGERLCGLMPGDAWWESGPETVVAWGAPRMPAKFMRGMVAPVAFEGRSTSEWIDGEPATRRGAWNLLVDRIITV